MKHNVKFSLNTVFNFINNSNLKILKVFYKQSIEFASSTYRYTIAAKVKKKL